MKLLMLQKTTLYTIHAVCELHYLFESTFYTQLIPLPTALQEIVLAAVLKDPDCVDPWCFKKMLMRIYAWIIL